MKYETLGLGFLALTISATGRPGRCSSPAESRRGCGAQMAGSPRTAEGEWLKVTRGPFPRDKPPLDAETLSKETVKLPPSRAMNPMRRKCTSSEITRSKVKFRSETDATVAAPSPTSGSTEWLLVPKSVTDAYEKDGTKSPVVVCLHSTTFGAGRSRSGRVGRALWLRDPKIGYSRPSGPWSESIHATTTTCPT